MEELFKELAKSFISGGIPGCILLIILWKIAPAVEDFKNTVYQAIKELKEAQDRATRAELIRIISSPRISSEVKETTAELIKEVNQATPVK